VAANVAPPAAGAPVTPLLVEERLEAEVAPGLVLVGKPDVVCREPTVLRDLKTGIRGPGSFAPQLGAYSLLARSNGIEIEHVVIDFVRRVAVGKPQPAPIRAEGKQERVEAKKERRAERERELAEATAAASAEIGDELFNVIYADPPWRFEPSRNTLRSAAMCRMTFTAAVSVWAISADMGRLCTRRN
jgi:hypothetical protein